MRPLGSRCAGMQRSLIRTTSSLLLFQSLAVPAQPAGAQEPSLLIENVHLVDGTGRPPMAGVNVLVQGNRITRVSRQPIEPSSQALRIDGQDRWLIPGMMDMHVHLQGGRGQGGPDTQLGLRALHGFLYSGFTSIFDAGNDPDFIFGLREREREGRIVSPRIFATGGLVTVPGGHGGGRGATLVESWPEARESLDAHLERQPDMVKITFDEHGWGTRPLIPLLPPTLMAEVGRYLNGHGIRTTVHVSHEFRARQAIEAGINTLAHPVIQGPVSEGFLQLMAATGTPMVSTLTIGDGYARLVDHPEFLDEPLYQAVYEPELIERMKTSVRDQYAARDWTTWMRVMNPIAQENLRRIAAAGGVIVLGSDQSSGPSAHRELELMVEGGIPALEVIRIATLNAAIFLGKERDLGSIEEGKLADMVLLSADPLSDISNTQRIEAVIKDGRLVDRSRLDLPVNR